MPDIAKEIGGLINAEMAEVKGLIDAQTAAVHTIDSKLGELEKKAAPAEVLEQVRSLAEKQQRRLDQLEAAREAMPATLEKKDWRQQLEAAAEFKSFLAAPRSGSYKIEFPLGLKTILGADELAPLDLPYYKPGIAQRPYRLPRAIDLVRSFSIGQATQYKFTRETLKSRDAMIHARLDGGIASNATSATLTQVQALQAGHVLRFHAEAGILEVTLTAVDPATNEVTWTGAIGGAGVEDGADVTCRRASGVAEKGAKPYTYLAAEQKTCNLIERPILLGITEQRLRNGTVAEWVRAELPRRLRRILSPEILYGRGADYLELSGLFSDPDLQSYAWSDGVEGDTMADAVLATSDLVESDGMKTCLINRNDWRKLTKQKTATELDYIHANGKAVAVIDTFALKSISDVLVYTDPDLEQGDFGVFDFEMASELPYQEAPSAFTAGVGIGAGVVAGLVGDQFARNELTLRYELALEQAVLEPLAYAQGEFDSAPAGE